MNLAAGTGDAGDFLGRQSFKKRNVGEERFDVDGVIGLHVFLIFAKND